MNVILLFTFHVIGEFEPNRFLRSYYSNNEFNGVQYLVDKVVPLPTTLLDTNHGRQDVQWL